MAELENNTQGNTPSVYDLPSLLQAKGYLDALADGMDPITGQPVEPDTLSNQNLRSVLHYASVVLADNIRVQELREKCQKQGLDFEAENKKILAKRAEKKAKAELKAAKHDKSDAKKAIKANKQINKTNNKK